MNKILLFFSLVFFTFLCKSQNGITKNTSYFDKNGKLTYVESAFYFRQNTDTVGYYRSFFANTKKKYFEGSIVNCNDTMDYNNKYKGVCKWYYSNGFLKNQSEYNDDGVLNGLKQEFDNEGKLIKNSVYENGKLKDNSYIEIDDNGNEIKVFNEEFSDNAMNWPVMTNEVASSKLKIGGYELVNKSNKEFNILSKKNIDSLYYSVEVSVNSNYLTPDTKSGIVFNFKDFENYSFFYVSKYRFHAGIVEEGKKTIFLDNFFSYELNGSGWNKIKVQILQDSLCYIINDKIQAVVLNSKKSFQHVGLSLVNGSSLFDNFCVKEYNKNSFIVEKRNREFYEINKRLLSVNQVHSGLILGKNGFILTSIKNLQQANDFLFELNINDTIKTFTAEIFYNSDMYNFTIFKLKNYISPSNFRIEYDYNYIKNTNPGVKTIIGFYEKTKLNKIEFIKIFGESKIINEHKHLYVGNYNNHNCQGAPVFDTEGNILGVISDIDKQNNIKIVLIQQVLNVLFRSPETNEIKHKSDFKIDDFNKKIEKNIVVIKVF